ncbi:MAG: L-carnitine CoA-transferase [Thermoleophilia bacterium]
MTREADVPRFGSLEGLRVVYAGSMIAGPFAAQVMADQGADVIWIENARNPDGLRVRLAIEQDRRNQRTLCLNLTSEPGRKILAMLLKDADIFLESSRGGQFARWGLSDELLWEWNAALTIVHISGYGQDGHPDYIGRASYDSVAQAFSCYLHQNGYPDRPPVPAYPFAGDYLTALFAWGAAMSAVYRAQRTGIGESIDVAQFEALLRVQAYNVLDYLNHGVKKQRFGSTMADWVCDGVFTCAGDGYVYVTTWGAPVYKALIEFLGFEYGSDDFPVGTIMLTWDSEAGPKLHQALADYCLAHDAQTVDATLNRVGVPCSVVMDYEMAATHPHYAARDILTEWPTVRGDTFKGVNVVPKQKRRPGQIWRGAPSIGMDNEDILADLGLSDEEIRQLYQEGVLRKATHTQGEGPSE